MYLSWSVVKRTTSHLHPLYHTCPCRCLLWLFSLFYFWFPYRGLVPFLGHLVVGLKRFAAGPPALLITHLVETHSSSVELARKWGITLERARRTVEAMTQRVVRTVLHPTLSRRFWTNDWQLRYRRSDMTPISAHFPSVMKKHTVYAGIALEIVLI